DLRGVFRICVRHRWPRRRGAGPGRRPYRHRVRLSGLRVPAGDRAARGVPAEDAESRALTRGQPRRILRFLVNALLTIVVIPPFFVPSIFSTGKTPRSAISKSGIRSCRTNVFVGPGIALKNIEMAHELIGKPLTPPGQARG